MNRVPYLSINGIRNGIDRYKIIIFVAELLFFVTAEKPDFRLNGKFGGLNYYYFLSLTK